MFQMFGFKVDCWLLGLLRTLNCSRLVSCDVGESLKNVGQSVEVQTPRKTGNDISPFISQSIFKKSESSNSKLFQGQTHLIIESGGKQRCN